MAQASVKQPPSSLNGQRSEPAAATPSRGRLRHSTPVSVLLEIGEGALGFACAGVLKGSDQRLIEHPLSFRLLPSLELGHAQIKQGIGVERFFPSAFLEQLDGARVFLFLVTQSAKKLGQLRVVR